MAPTTGRGTNIHLKSIVVRLLLLIALVTLLSILIVAVGLLLLISTLVSIMILLLVSLFLGGLILVFKGCILTIQFLRVNATLSSATISGGKVIKPWLIASIKRFVRWLIPLLLWYLWRWASTTTGTNPGAPTNHPFQPRALGS